MIPAVILYSNTRLALWHSLVPLPDYHQISQGKYRCFQPMSPLYLRFIVLCSIGLLLVLQHHPQWPAW